MLRLTWVQPEDLIGHELRQAAQDGREPGRIAARWRAAGGPEAPAGAGASSGPVSRYLRLLAEDLLDELADLPSRLADDEPTDLPRIRALCPDWPTPAAQPRPAPTVQGLEAAWLGRAAGCLLGKPVEKLPLTAIRQLALSTGNWPLNTWFTAKGVPEELATAHPWNRRSATTSLAENIDGMPEDDDLNYPLLGLLLLQRHGPRFTTTDVARLWLDELPAGRTFTAERIAYRNLLCGLEPPLTARHRNPFREWIGALIRADVHGWTNPGDPAGAAEQVYRDATLTHTANGVYAAMFTAATIAVAATGTHDIHTCLRTGLTVVPPRSRLAEAVRHGIRLAASQRDFTTVVDELHATHAATHHWVHAVPNTALIAAALTHADGDFTGSICRAVSGGWDTDSNGATAGSVAALLAGSPAALPDRWTGPLKNRLATSVADFDGTGFDTLARLTHSLTLTHAPGGKSAGTDTEARYTS
ncbi:ADP-ribosylglycohydrolase family protein [Streptomyces turgidiscabies]|uniref:ADP-ribosylglycohydrolase n=1 Tax=Streptomyces turgidiscabies (strain Car8) TaxID=698760 RepID=L7F525_STRT8|nr:MULTISPECIES: ADP-ribosylglycohydrolase family protein [Streptomyces]ELP66417.1 ADP-ribosylglycohydrolase [Streptomyces turgidiscabies Car8]MDX3497419.1 ADP-ribosylglycohydrolase family protein [Streptomyces turgidiscabies]GAQ72290.1 ADP-ribosylglycohydrolase [Streptomyces turgidiscabies]